MRHGRIAIDPAVMAGKPVIKGTRITVEMIAGKLAAGMTAEAIVADHPHLRKDDIAAAQIYALEGNYLGPAQTDKSFPAVLRWIGAACSKVTKAEHSWSFDFGEAGQASAECPWRIVDDGQIAASAPDDGQKFGLPEPFDAQARASDLLVGRRVVRIAIAPVGADLRVEFEGRVVLELLNLSSGYEAWNATFADGSGVVRLIALGGGGLARYERSRA